MPGDPLDKLLDDLAGEYTSAPTPPPAPPPASMAEGSAAAASKPAPSKAGGGTTAAPATSLPLGDDDLHPSLRELLRPEPPSVPLDLASDAAFVPSSTTSSTASPPLPSASPLREVGEGPGVRPTFVPSSAASFSPAPPAAAPGAKPFVPSSSIAVTPPRPPPAPSLKAPVAPRGAPPPGYAVAAPAPPAGAPEHALLASIQRDELAALQREQERLRREEEIARMRAAQEQRRQQEEAARREAEIARALRTQAEQFLKQLDPYSVEGLWFNEFARKHPDRLTAAITYLREVKKG